MVFCVKMIVPLILLASMPTTKRKAPKAALRLTIMWLILQLFFSSTYANPDNMGQFIQIETRLHSFVGRPSWLIIIRDIDHNQNIPYLYDVERGNNFWVALTYSNHYLITASKLSIETYQSRYNKYKSYHINNFCHLESNGRISRGESMRIILEGNLTPNSNTSRCTIIRYKDPATFVAVPPTMP